MATQFWRSAHRAVCRFLVEPEPSATTGFLRAVRPVHYTQHLPWSAPDEDQLGHTRGGPLQPIMIDTTLPSAWTSCSTTTRRQPSAEGLGDGTLLAGRCPRVIGERLPGRRVLPCLA